MENGPRKERSNSWCDLGICKFTYFIRGSFGPEYSGPTKLPTLIFALPATIVIKILYPLDLNFLEAVAISFIRSIFIGALLGYGIAKIYLKAKK